jgi:glyoxylase-like metal-dependent hydrolase (beta-lactamase superfamily II)
MPEQKETIWIDNWYEIHSLPNDVTAIGEPKHSEDVFCYLIKGRDKDLLIDTGMGIVPITHALEKLRNSTKPLDVVNTHWHFDHIGGNKYFDKILVPKHIDEVTGLLSGWSPKDLAKYDFIAGFRQSDGMDNTPTNFDPENFFIPPSRNIEPVLKNGRKIDLGNRDIFIIETPGHTPGSICLFDETNGLLFTGDLLYEGPLYAFEEESNPNQYLGSLRKTKKIYGDRIKIIHPGHNYPENNCEPNLLNEAIKLFSMAKAKKSYDEKLNEFPGAVDYVYPGLSKRPGNGQRRLKVVVSKEYVRWK